MDQNQETDLFMTDSTIEFDMCYSPSNELII